MPISFGSTGVGTAGTVNGTTATWQHVVGSSVTALVVAVTASAWPAPTITARVGSRTMTSLGTVVSSGSGHRVEIFGLLSPPTGAQSVTVTTSMTSNIAGNSVAYTGVASFGTTYTAQFFQVSYGMTQTTAVGNWLVGGFSSNSAIGLISPAAIGVSRDIRQGAPCIGILDSVSTGGSTTLRLAAGANASGSGVMTTLVPVDTSTALAHTAFASLALTATPTTTADATSVRMAVAPLSLTAIATASATTLGNRQAASTAAITATRTATMFHGARFAASLAVTAARPAVPRPSLWIFNSSTPVVATRTATATVTPAPIPDPVAHSPLRYVGRYPDTEGAISPRSYADAANERTKVTGDFINQAVDAQVHSLATTAYVDQQDALRAFKTNVTGADNDYIPNTGHGLSTLNWVNKVEEAQINTGAVVTNRQAVFLSATGGGSQVTSSLHKAQQLVGIVVNDPGWPYVIVPFGWVEGSDPNGTSPSRWSGTGNAGKVIVMAETADRYFGMGLCASSTRSSRYPVMPAPIGNQRLTGNTLVGMYGSMLTERVGASYTFGSASLTLLILPAK